MVLCELKQGIGGQQTLGEQQEAAQNILSWRNTQVSSVGENLPRYQENIGAIHRPKHESMEESQHPSGRHSGVGKQQEPLGILEAE